MASIPGSPPPGPAPSAHAAGEGGNKAGAVVSSELWALVGQGSGHVGARTPVTARGAMGSLRSTWFCLVRLSPFIDEKMEAQNGEGAFLRSHSGWDRARISVQVCLLPIWADRPQTV